MGSGAGDVVRVGIKAPRSVTVHREELLRELEETNRASASPSADAIASIASLAAGRQATRPD